MRKITLLSIVMLITCFVQASAQTQEPLWTANGQFTSPEKNGSATIACYAPDSYSILGFLGEDGYNLDFTIAEDGSYSFTNAYYVNDIYEYVYAGSDSSYVCIYNGAGYVTLTGDKDLGNFQIYVYTYDAAGTYTNAGYYEFNWPSEQVLWSAPVNYDFSTWNTGSATLTAYESVYILSDFVTAKDIRFTVDGTTKEIVPANADYAHSEEYPGYWYYGLTSDYDCIGLYTLEGMSSFSGDSNGGTFTLAYEYYASYEDENPAYSGTLTVTWNASGVTAVTFGDEKADQAIYSLGGRRVPAADVLKKGIYIINKKKVVR